MVQFIFGLKRIIFWFGLWGIIMFIFGYAMNGKIWDSLGWIWRALGGT